MSVSGRFRIAADILKSFAEKFGWATVISAQSGTTMEGVLASFMALTDVVTKDFDKIAEEWENKAKEAMEQLQLISDPQLKDTIGQSVQKFQQFRLWGQGVLKAFGSLGGWITFAAVAAEALAIYEAAFSWFITNFEYFWKPERMKEEPDPIKRLEKWLTLQKDFNRVVNVLSVLGSHSVYGNALGLDVFARLLTNVSWTLGIGWLSWIAMGPGLRASLAEPLEQLYAQEMQLERLPREVVQALYRRGYITEEEADDMLKLLGYNEERRKLILKLQRETFTETQIEDMLEKGLITEADAREMLRRLGWLEEDLDKRVQLARWRTLVARVEKLLEEDLITEAEAGAMLRSLGLSEQEVYDKLEQARKRTLVALKRKLISAYEDAYVDGFVREEDVANVRAISLEDTSIDAMRTYIMRFGREVELKRLRLKTFQEQFLDGTIDEDTLRARLSEIILSPEVLEAVVENLKARKEPRQRIEREETLERRKRTLENQLEMLTLQIRHQQQLQDSALRLIDVRMERVRRTIEAEIDRVRRLAEARKAAIEAEFQISREAEAAEIEARIRQIQGFADARVREILAELEARKRAIDEELEAFRTATAIEIETRVAELRRIAETQTGAAQERTLIRAEFLDDIKTLPVIRREVTAETRKRLLEDMANAEVERVKAEAEARVELLSEIAAVAVAEREARKNRLIERIQAEAEARIAQLQERLTAQLEELSERRREAELRYSLRIEQLQTRANQVREELEIVEAALMKK